MKRKDFMKLGVMFVCFSLAAGVPGLCSRAAAGNKMAVYAEAGAGRYPVCV